MPFWSIPKRAQVCIICFWIIGWATIGIVWFNLLPAEWQFARWPRFMQGLSKAACVLFVMADLLFMVWFFAAQAAEAYGDKPDSSA